MRGTPRSRRGSSPEPRAGSAQRRVSSSQETDTDGPKEHRRSVRTVVRLTPCVDRCKTQTLVNCHRVQQGRCKRPAETTRETSERYRHVQPPESLEHPALPGVSVLPWLAQLTAPGSPSYPREAAQTTGRVTAHGHHTDACSSHGHPVLRPASSSGTSRNAASDRPPSVCRFPLPDGAAPAW